MNNTKMRIESIMERYGRYDNGGVPAALCLIAEQKRIENLIRLKELGYQIPEEEMFSPLVGKEMSDKIIRDTEEMRQDMGIHRSTQRL